MDRRLAEAARLGFTDARWCRPGVKAAPPGLRAISRPTTSARHCKALQRDRGRQWRSIRGGAMAVKSSGRPTANVVQLARPTLRETIGRLAPGTALRDGLERILRGRTGALIVLGYDDSVEAICDGGFSLDVALRAHPAARAVEDGRRGGAVQRRHPDPAGQRAAGARPVDPHRRVRHPAPLRGAHRGPDRLSRCLGEPFDEHRDGLRRRRAARGARLRDHPVARQPDHRHAGALQVPPRRGAAGSCRPRRSRTSSRCAT